MHYLILSFSLFCLVQISGRKLTETVSVCDCVCTEDAPVISCLQEDVSVLVGDRVLVSCSVNANPGSLLTWMTSVDGKPSEHITDPTVNTSIKVCSHSRCRIGDTLSQ